MQDLFTSVVDLFWHLFASLKPKLGNVIGSV